MELVHLLTRSGLTYLEVSSKVYHDSFCQLGSNVSLPCVTYFEAFYLHVISSFTCSPVIFPKLVLFLAPLQFVHLFCNPSKFILLFFHITTNMSVQRLKVAILPLNLPCSGPVTHSGEILTTGKFHSTNKSEIKQKQEFTSNFKTKTKAKQTYKGNVVSIYLFIYLFIYVCIYLSFTAQQSSSHNALH